MKRSSLVLAVLAVLGGVAPVGTAQADRLSATRDQALVEVSHTVDVTIDEGVARYRVRRTFANNGTLAEEASLRIELAHGAAVTGLRIRARERWYDGVLMDAEEARAKYRELTGIGQWEAKDPALMQWVWADQVNLQVFPVLPGAVSTVEYTLTAPLEYRSGRHVLTYPHTASVQGVSTLALTDPVLRVDPGHGDMRTEIKIGGQRVAPNTPVVLRAPPPLAWIGDGEAEDGVGYVFSKLTVDRSEAVTKATVDLEIDHTFRGDLRVSLVTPGGEHLAVTEGEGGENDIRGQFAVELPAGANSAGDWHLIVADKAGLDIGTLDAWSLMLEPTRAEGTKITAKAADLPRFIPDAPDAEGDAGHTLIEVAPAPVRTLAARLGRVVASAQHGFHRLEIDAAPRLSQLPRKASVVFVLDRSRSVSEEALASQLRIIDAYRSHVPDASVEIVAFDRDARRVFGEFVGADKFTAALASAKTAGKLGPGNGSALEAGLALAAEALAGRSGPTRIVAMTDAQLRTRFTNKLADAGLAGAPATTVTHVVIPEDDSYAYIRRDDGHALAPIADGHRGVLFAVAAPADDKTVPAQMLGLVRPIAIDYFKVSGMDLSEAGDVPEVLREGDGYRAMLATPNPTRRVVLTGKLWAAPVRRVVAHSEHFDIATAAFVFSEDEHDILSPEEMRVVAFRGRAVSPVTSYLATEPGVRPSTDGLEEMIGDSFGLGGIGMGGGGMGTGTITLAPPTLEGLLARDIERCLKSHAPTGNYQLTLAVETTGVEIVDVEAKTSTHAPLRDCMVEATWAFALPDASWPERMDHTITLP